MVPRLRLRWHLRQQQLSKRQFAKLMGMRYPNVFRMFRKDYDPKLSVLAKAARVLGVRIRDLYREPKK